MQGWHTLTRPPEVVVWESRRYWNKSHPQERRNGKRWVMTHNIIVISWIFSYYNRLRERKNWRSGVERRKWKTMQREEAKRGEVVGTGKAVKGKQTWRNSEWWWWGSGVSVIMCNQTHSTAATGAATVLSSLRRLFLYFFWTSHHLPRFFLYLSFLQVTLLLPKAYVSHIFLAWFHVSSSTLCPLPSTLSTFTSLPATLMYRSQQIKQNPPYKFQPSSSNQPNCCRTSCLRERGFLCWETLLNGIKSAIESTPLSHC